MAEEKKQGTKVTWHGKEGDPPVDVIYGVAVKRGESVDFADHMSEEQARRFAGKLAANPAFEVEGSPRAKAVAAPAFTDPTTINSAAAQVAGARLLAERQGREPPEGYDAPLQAVLESQNATLKQGKAAQEQPASQRSTPPRGR